MTWVSEPLDGLALRDQGMARAMTAAVPWPDLALSWLRSRQPGDLFTSEDVIEAVGLPRGEVAKDRNNAVGAVMRAAATRDLIVRVAYVPATRRNSHGAVIGLWRRL